MEKGHLKAKSSPSQCLFKQFYSGGPEKQRELMIYESEM